MRRSTITVVALAVALLGGSCGGKRDLVSQIGLNRRLYNEAHAVLRVKLLEVDSACDKYCWQTVRMLSILKNTTQSGFEEPFRIAHESWQSGIPQGNSIVYLRPYSTLSDSLCTMTGYKFLTALTVD